MAVSPNPVFKFSGQMCGVKIENIPPPATRQEILKLFTTLIGDVRRCDEFVDEAKHRIIEMEFTSCDAAKKALCMTGYTVSGIPITVTAMGNAVHHRQPRESKSGDERRNLYVLGLPFDLTKPEFIEIFSRHGRVSHAVILATVDNASRRRGFVVMGTHNEAKLAMNALSRKEIKGHTIDVSWAVVQRSQGFLDGGDRTMVLSQQTQNTSKSDSLFDSQTIDSGCSSEISGLATPASDNGMQHILSAACPVPALLVTNLPSVLFSQVTDLHPLLCPFGEIVNLKIVSEKHEEGTISVFVEYKTASQAKEASEALCGQLYASKPVNVEFVQPTPPLSADSGMDCWPSSKFGIRTGLNPLAAPFLAERIYPADPPITPLPYCTANFSHSDKISIAKVVTRDYSPFYDAPTFRSNVPVTTGMYGMHLATHRPHSAPSE
ncbi:hypothetical protein BDY19DRAFT_955626 [Irpex rosettiformis]|uniref:Uncharacterized protein n=1 Tax=Irpex rosettiformis TaxID=378272 RepID=A0ACB8TZG7_9APHY|nr:hypothetical protein BDY19DRAFT_955626 [Irpex rosettiformis]